MTVNIRTIKDIRLFLKSELGEFYQAPELNTISNIIIKTVLNVTGLHQVYNPETTVSQDQEAKIRNLCNELKEGKPVQYVIGSTTFYNCRIKVNNSVLIPRPETEELVDLIVKENPQYTGNIFDLGTGSGCIAIALASNFPKSTITGFDISEEALNLARENAQLNNVKISFQRSDIFKFNYKKFHSTGIIVSNPPYVRQSEKQFMSKNVLLFEPSLALYVDDSEPLVYYKAIMKIAEKILISGGKIYFEINEAMGDEISSLLRSYSYADIRIIKDLNNKNRIATGIKNG